MPIEELLMIGTLSGCPVLLIGVAAANVAVYRMQKRLNLDLEEKERVSPWRVIGKGSFVYHPAANYCAKFSDGPLNRQLHIAYWLCGIGGVIGIGSGLISKAVFR